MTEPTPSHQEQIAQAIEDACFENQHKLVPPRWDPVMCAWCTRAARIAREFPAPAGDQRAVDLGGPLASNALCAAADQRGLAYDVNGDPTDEQLARADADFVTAVERIVGIYTPAPSDAADGQANTCPHGSASGIDQAPIGPGKVWRCDHCGLLWTDQGPADVVDGQANTCPHGSATGIDQALIGPDAEIDRLTAYTCLDCDATNYAPEWANKHADTTGHVVKAVMVA